MLETLSLQGIFGFFSLLCFYGFGVYFAVNRQQRFENGNLLFVIIPVFTFGLTDVVLIQSNSALVIIIALALSLPFLKKAQ